MQKLLEDARMRLVSAIILLRIWMGRKACALRTEGASHFVEILVAIIIVIAIGAVFKDQIVAFINTITGNATTHANALF